MGVIRDELSDYFLPNSSMQSRQVLHQAIEQLTPSGTTSLAQGLDDLLVRVGRRGVMVVRSDFLVDSMDGVVAGIRNFRARGWEVVGIHLIHPDEQYLPDGVAFRFSGREDYGVVNSQL